MNRGLTATGIGVGLVVVLGLFFFFDRKEESAQATSVADVSASTDAASAQSSAATSSVLSSKKKKATTETTAAPTEPAASTAQGGDPLGSVAAEAELEANDNETAGDKAGLQEAAIPSDHLSLSEAEASEEYRRPSFDIVRVEQNGDAVIAGSAPPGSLVIVLDGDTPIGQVVADASGSWVLLPGNALAPGTHELRIVVRLDSGLELTAERVAIISLAGPGTIEAIKDAKKHGLATAVEDITGPSPTVTVSLDPDAGGQAAVEQTALSPAPLVVLVPDEATGASQVLQGSEVLKGEGISKDGLVLDSIDYDEHGKAVIAGRGEPGSKVVVYLDNKPLAAVEVDEEGNWPAVLDKPIDPGLHSLRIDQVNESGAVVARVETPFSRADVTSGDLAEGAVVVQPGNSLWRIARRVYGQGVRYTVIYQANNDQIRDPHLIYPGQIFTLPKAQ